MGRRPSLTRERIGSVKNEKKVREALRQQYYDAHYLQEFGKIKARRMRVAGQPAVAKAYQRMQDNAANVLSALDALLWAMAEEDRNALFAEADRAKMMAGLAVDGVKEVVEVTFG